MWKNRRIVHLLVLSVNVFQLLILIPVNGGDNAMLIMSACLSIRLSLNRIKVKLHTLDIAPVRSESPPQKRSGMSRVLKVSNSFTCTPTRSSAIGMSHICLCLPSYSW